MGIRPARLRTALYAALAAVPLAAQAPPSAFVNFEGAQTSPIRISADGTRLFALNTPNGTLSVFSLTAPHSASQPGLIAEIPVGIEPVSVNINPNVPGNDEAWVANQVSNSVSVVSVSKGIVTDTLYAKAEPADIVFAGNKLAFVSVARTNLINVYNTSTHALVKSIPLTGEYPRALAVSPDGSTVYTAFALSGNHTTILRNTEAPPQPPPTNPNLPPAPQVGLIVDAYNPTWSSIVKWTMPDNDVAAISTSSLSVTSYFPHLGTENLALAVSSQTGDLYVANTDALNLVQFETNLQGHVVNHQISMLNPSNGQTQIWDLNPGIDYAQLPNPSAVSIALAMPTALTFDTTGRYLYVAAFGTDRVGIFDTTTGLVTGFIEIDPQAIGATVNPSSKRGPRGLALNASAGVLYVLNRIYNTISIINLASNTVTAEIATGSFDPTPAVIRNGRGFLYDHKLSGNGTGACASCHIDADLDMLAWNLGDPSGNLSWLVQDNQSFTFHPMKGPMLTQTLRGLPNLEPYHWRGDQADLSVFSTVFADLLGGSALAPADMAAFANFINTLTYLPNPNVNLDGSLPTAVPLPEFPNQTASAVEGKNLFLNTAVGNGGLTCSSCHTADPGPGTNLKLKLSVEPQPDMVQPMKTAQLRNLYQRTNLSFLDGHVSVNGFGYNHDGTGGGLYQFFGDRFPNFANKPAEKKAIEAYELCFDTGTPPAVGYARTLTSANVNGSAAQTDWTTLESQASAGNIDLIANGTVQGQVHGLLYVPANNNYQTDIAGLGPFTRTQLTGFIQKGDILTVMGVPFGSGQRMALVH